MSYVIEKKLNESWQRVVELQAPGLYDVILHNDDFTPLQFVIELLKLFFHLDDTKAKTIAQEAHTKGRAVCGTYSREVAETRIDQALEYARTHDHPLKWSMEAT